tara:strand:- start:42 stop:440 length:399 start_codon:yes stop_codon:yes gene_type:complete
MEQFKSLNNMNKIYHNLYSDLTGTSKQNSGSLTKFFFNTKNHYLITMYIISKKNQKTTLEEISYDMSPKVISRSTIQNILKDGVNTGFLKKMINKKDKRSKFYLITDEGKKIIKHWAVKKKQFFENLDTLNF